MKVVRHPGESDEQLLKRFKKLIDKSGLMSELRQRSTYDPQVDRKKRLKLLRKMQQGD